MNSKDYAGAHHDLDTIVRRWTDYANAYTLKAEVFLHEKDTLKAAEWLDKGLNLIRTMPMCGLCVPISVYRETMARG